MDNALITEFINCLKKLNHSNSIINLPKRGEYKQLKANSSNYTFVIDVNLKGRKGNITLQLRSLNHQDKPIIRLDISGPDHQNPEGNFDGAGEIIPCPHIHIAQEGYGDSIAYPINHDSTRLYLTNECINDLVIVLRQFLDYINTGNIHDFEFYHQEQFIFT